MLPDILILYIVLAPGLVALTGLVHKQIGDKVVMGLTTAVVLSAGALSLIQLFAYVAGLGGHTGTEEHHASLVAATTGMEIKQHVITLMPWISVGEFQANWAIRVDTLSIV
ncbi:MAG TPA: NADH-quinone oxidoreductase subunit L, partial [Hyphomonas sp.]|nr:NADH-quinone oxidoreductase subunit L [Hyphomonas sp.]